VKCSFILFCEYKSSKFKFEFNSKFGGKLWKDLKIKKIFLTSTQDGPKPSSLWNQPSPSTGYFSFSVHSPVVLTPAHHSSRPAPAKSPAGQPPSSPRVTLQPRKMAQSLCPVSAPLNPDPTHSLARDRSSYPHVRLNPSFTPFSILLWSDAFDSNWR
jgi:hypothetical protein